MARLPATRVIAILDGGRYVGVDQLQLASRLGARRVLAKPFQGREILAAIDEVLRG